MPVATKLPPPSEPRAILKPAGNKVAVVSGEARYKKDTVKTPQRLRNLPPEIPDSVVLTNVSLDTTSSSDSCTSNSSAKKVKAITITPSRRSVKRNGFKPVRVVPDAVDVATVSPTPKTSPPPKRCEWITANSVCILPYPTDRITLSRNVISSLQTPCILLSMTKNGVFQLMMIESYLSFWSFHKHWQSTVGQQFLTREKYSGMSISKSTNFLNHATFREPKLFENFDPSSVAQFTDKKLLTLKINGNSLLSEPKLRAIVENAKQLLKVQQEFGSFSNYCWRFVNHKPMRNEFRYGRQVPVKTPKAEVISKDMMRRGFQCVGPTVVYSFMQVAGLVNDHLLTCFRHQECKVRTKNEFKTEVEEKKVQNETSELT
ncbi:guaA, partial [Mucuna pruriens]